MQAGLGADSDAPSPAAVAGAIALRRCLARPLTAGQRRRTAGFTLIEIIVALAVFAIVAVVIYRSTGSVLLQTQHVEERTLATWVARNTLAELELAREQPRQPLPPGRDSRDATLGGRNWKVQTDVASTTHPHLQRVDVSVWPAESAGSDRPAARVTGFLGVY